MADWHLAQYRHNAAFASDVDSAVYPDWQIVGLFYAALHLVQHELTSQLGTAPRGHDDRQRWMERCSRTRPIMGTYLDLRSLADRFRYKEPYSQAQPHHIADAQKLLATIEEHLAPE